jgi:hypothetical protein
VAVAFIENHWVKDRAVDMTGQTVNGCRVVERAPGAGRSARWRVIASCGHEVLITRDELLRRVREGRPDYECKTCRESRFAAIPEKKTCARCGAEKPAGEFYRRAERRGTPLQARCKACWNLPRLVDRVAEPIGCRVCFDQPWRRPVCGCKCGGQYEDEDLSIARHHAMSNAARWVFPDQDFGG